MLYELHITVPPSSDLKKWSDLCEGRAVLGFGAKPLDIRLHGGFMDNPRQIMFATTLEGTDAKANIWVEDWKLAVNKAGFPYERVKLEVPLDKSKNYDVVYYETHVKALVPEGMFTVTLNAAFADEWAVSSNALYSKDDGMNKMYFTKRVDGKGDLYQAAAYFRDEFKRASWTDYCHAVRMESEAVILDTNTDMDKGWA